MSVCLASDALASVPLIGFHSHSEHMFRRKLFLSKVGGQPKFILFSINEVV